MISRVETLPLHPEVLCHTLILFAVARCSTLEGSGEHEIPSIGLFALSPYCAHFAFCFSNLVIYKSPLFSHVLAGDGISYPETFCSVLVHGCVNTTSMPR